MTRPWSITLLATLLTVGTGAAQQPARMRIAAPELRDVTEWVNTTPMQLGKLKGKVVVLHFWAFG
jgi:hypothetical protein